MHLRSLSLFLFLFLFLFLPSAIIRAQTSDSAAVMDSLYRQMYEQKQKAIEKKKAQLTREKMRMTDQLESSKSSRRLVLILIVLAVFVVLAGIIFLIVWLVRK